MGRWPKDLTASECRRCHQPLTPGDYHGPLGCVLPRSQPRPKPRHTVHAGVHEHGTMSQTPTRLFVNLTGDKNWSEIVANAGLVRRALRSVGLDFCQTCGADNGQDCDPGLHG